jgi:hypothetical protein
MATLRETSIDPIDYGPVMAALHKARAAWWLIDAFEHGYVQVRYAGLGVRAKQKAECGRIRDRVYQGALDDLEEALAEAEAALREAMTPEHPPQQPRGAQREWRLSASAFPTARRR